MPLTLIPANTHIHFIRGRWVGFIISTILILSTAYMLATKGLNYGIDFAGGVLMEIRTEQPLALSEVRNVLADRDYGEVSLQHFGDERSVLIRIELSEAADQGGIVADVKETLGAMDANIDYRQVDYVGPTVGQELISSGIWSLVIAFSAVLLYVWFRFEWQFGLGAVIALLHDAFLMLGFYAVSGFDFGLTSIAAILTVVGYSINDSVVIYDRIRETMRKFKKMPTEELLDKSINNTLSRTIITALTTILAALALVLLGGEVLRGFSAALLFGVVVGTYSSVYVAAPILLYFDIRKNGQNADASGATPKNKAPAHG